MQRRIIIVALALACGVAQARVIGLKAPGIISVVNHVMSSTAATSAPPSVAWFTPTNGQALAGYVPRNYGSAGHGTNFGGVYTNRATGISAFLHTARTNSQFNSAWMTGATQLTILVWARVQDESQNIGVGRGLYSEWNTEFKRVIIGAPGPRFYSFHSQGGLAYRSIVVPANEWLMLGQRWNSDGTLAVFWGATNITALSSLDASPIPTAPISSSANKFTFGHADADSYVAWYSDSFSTTNTMSDADIAAWYTNTAAATYNSNWPSLFTGDVEITWREWSTNAP